LKDYVERDVEAKVRRENKLGVRRGFSYMRLGRRFFLGGSPLRAFAGGL